MGIRRSGLIGLSLFVGLAAASDHANGEALLRETVAVNAPSADIDPADQHLDLHLKFIDSTIYNPASKRAENVSLRGYVIDKVHGEETPAGFENDTPSPFIAPTIVADPGETIKITLHNDLPAEPNCKPENINTPHCFNTTNLHTHGLWVSPEEDNVFKSIKPDDPADDYVYHIPADHPGGTLWYHPHQHGSTAIQVGGGVAGALIIRGTAKPTKDHTGEIDTLLAPLAPKERILVFQQIQYACFDDKGEIKTNPDKTWRCDPNDVGQLKNYSQLGFPAVGPDNNWTVSGRFTSVNGYIMPHFVGAVAGQLERWRFIDAGLANTIGVVFRRMKDGAGEGYRELNSKDNALWVKANCTGDEVRHVGIASDGLTLTTTAERGRIRSTLLQPGYREDVLVAFPRAGRYCLIDTQVAAADSISQTVQRPQLLGVVDVTGDKTVPDQIGAIRQLLTDAAGNAGYDAETTAAVRADLRASPMRLSRFVPHSSLLRNPLNSNQEVAFSGGFKVGNDIAKPEKDRQYNPKEWRVLKLGATDQWTVTSRAGGHPFHIHVNPFEIIAIYDPTGKDVSGSDSQDSEYASLKGVWRDTLFVKTNYKAVLRTEYRQFTGGFVLHCHILDHEDKGMMENVMITETGTIPAGMVMPEHHM